MHKELPEQVPYHLLFHDVEKIVFGFVEMFVSNNVLDMVLNGNRQSVQFLIFSQKHDEIAVYQQSQRQLFTDENRQLDG